MSGFFQLRIVKQLRGIINPYLAVRNRVKGTLWLVKMEWYADDRSGARHLADNIQSSMIGKVPGTSQLDYISMV